MARATDDPKRATVQRVSRIANHDLIRKGFVGLTRRGIPEPPRRKAHTAHQDFAPINCGAISRDDLEAGLAVLRKARLVTDPALGVDTPFLVLDEIGELSPDLQTYMLRILEEHATANHYAESPHTHVRIVSLTNRVMLDEIAHQRFRSDLFYRLGALTIKVPPLKDRGEDILLIAEHYNRVVSNTSGREPLVFRSDVQEALMTHSWPGNVREMRNFIAGLHVMARDRIVGLTDLPGEVLRRHVSPLPTDVKSGGIPFDECTPVLLKDAEARLIRDTLVENGGNISRVAGILGISRPTLYRKIKTYGIKECSSSTAHSDLAGGRQKH